MRWIKRLFALLSLLLVAAAALAATPRLAGPVAVLAQAAVERSSAALPFVADMRRLEAVGLAR